MRTRLTVLISILLSFALITAACSDNNETTQPDPK